MAGAALGQTMQAEMAEQPDRLAALLARREELAKQVQEVVPDRLAGTVLVARGSSDHAATCGAYCIEMATHRPVASTSPSITTLYHSPTDFSGYLMVAVSQSGQTPEIVEVVERARASGARTIGVTNDPDSPLADVADLVVALDVGPERAVPATKTVTAQLTAFAIIAQALGDVGLSEDATAQLPELVGQVLADTGPVAAVAEWLAGADRLVTVARGLLYGAAQEVALKVAETTSRFTTAYSAADLRHGPIAVASTGVPVLALAHPGPAEADVIDVVGQLRARGASVRLAGPVPASDLPWPAAPEVVAPVLAVVRGQQLALALARRLGRDPDAPPGLTKVTLT